MTSSYVGENKEFERQFLSGELEVELTPQGTLAERLRAGGAGHPRVLHPGRGRHPGGRRRAAVALRRRTAGSPWPPRPKETREFDGRTYVLERGITADFALVRAERRPTATATCVFDTSTRNFNPLAAMAGRITIAEVERAGRPRRDRPGVGAPARDLRAAGARRSGRRTVAAKRIERRTVSRTAQRRGGEA